MFKKLLTSSLIAVSAVALPCGISMGTAEAAPSKPLAGKIIAVDAGHNFGGHLHLAELAAIAKARHLTSCTTEGTSTKDGYWEASFNWDVANRLKADLQAKGATVVMTRTDNTGIGPCIVDRDATIVKSHANLTISIHADGADGRNERGFHVIYPSHAAGGASVNASSKAFATRLRDVMPYTGMPKSNYIGGGTALSPRGDLQMMNAAHIPTALVESGNMRNAADAALEKSATFRQKEADILTIGILHYYGK